MLTQPLIPAAEYVRMSTDDQPNSVLFQRETIRNYAVKHGFQVVATYSDLGKSGIEIKHRPGLRTLIQDVVSEQIPFKAILVYDVSRWGRFQDTDEAAHYEFLCRSAGVPVHYCAEEFQNDGRMPNEIMKALKRTMAAEFSRELAAKVSAGCRQIANQGFRLGGIAGYGLRRMLISADGRRKQILQSNEHKNIRTDHTILVPGPKHEVECIRMIFALAADEGKTPRQIADELNRKGIKYLGNGSWTKLNVYLVLKNEKYIGTNVWGKTTKPFNRYTRRLPASTWVTKPNAFVPLVSSRQFTRVQEIMQERNYKVEKPDNYYLDDMKIVLVREGKLTQKLLKQKGVFDHRLYLRRFGSMMRAYELVGYKPSAHAFRSTDGFRKMQRLRKDLLHHLSQLFPSHVRIVQRPDQSCRRVLELDHHLLVGVHICRPLRPSLDGRGRWLLVGTRKEENLIALVCLSDENLNGFMAYYVVPEFGGLIKRFKVLREGHPWLAAGRRLESLSQFYEATNEVLAAWNPQNDITVAGDTTFAERAALLVIGSKEVKLSRIESIIFKLLIQNAGGVVPRNKLGCCADKPTEWFLRAHISALRKKLGKKFRNRIITVPGEGYMYGIN